MMLRPAILGCLWLLTAVLQSPQAHADAAQRDTLRVGVNSLPVGLGNPYKGNGRPGTLVWYALYDGLTMLDELGKVRPALATDWQRVSATTWRFRLRAGVRFANGKPLDARAVTRNLAWFSTAAGRATVIGNELKGIAGLRVIDPLTLEVDTTEPDPILPKRMIGALIVEPDLWESLGPDRFALQPVGTGPYVLERWDERTRRGYAKLNPYAWRKAHFRRITWVELPDAAARTQALLSEDVDVAPVEIEELDRLTSRSYRISATPSMSVMMLGLINTREGPSPLKDVRVRQALNYAIDKQTIADVLLRGYGRAGSQPAPRITFGHDPALEPYPYDPARARRMLAEAGYPDGFELRAEIQTNSFPADSLIYQAMAHYLREVGVRVTLRVLPVSQYLQKFSRNTFTGDAFGTALNSSPYNDVTRPMETFSCLRPKAFFCDPALAAQLTQARQIADDDERERALQRLSKAYRDAAPSVFLVEQVDLYAYHPRLAPLVMQNRVPVFERMRWLR